MTQFSDDVKVFAPSRAEMDLQEPEQIRSVMRRYQPQLVINAAAYTAVDQAESDPDLAMRINADAPAVIAEEAQRLGAALIHYSTDYVFDGTQAAPYEEDATPHPLNVYGRSKLLGEQHIARLCQAHWIVRCSWIYSTHGRNFLRTFWRLAQQRQELQVVDDQIGAPTWARSIGAATAQMLNEAMRSSNGVLDYIGTHAGIYHMAAHGQTSWHGMAMHILQRMEKAGIALLLTPEHLLAIPSDSYPTAAQRPMNSKLATEKLARVFKVNLPDWHDDLDACMTELLQSPAA